MDTNTGAPNPSQMDEERALEELAAAEAIEEADKAALAEKNKQLFERAKKAEEFTKELLELAGVKNKAELRERLAALKAPTPQPETPPASSATLDEKYIEEKVDLRLAGYSKEEIDYIAMVAKAKNISLTEASKDRFVQAGIEGLRAKARSEQATPAPSGRTSGESPESFGLETSEGRKKASLRAFEKLQKTLQGGNPAE